MPSFSSGCENSPMKKNKNLVLGEFGGYRQASG
jgi:hypothetical protein